MYIRAKKMAKERCGRISKRSLLRVGKVNVKGETGYNVKVEVWGWKFKGVCLI